MLRMATDKLKIRFNPPHPSHPRSISCDNMLMRAELFAISRDTE